jgi:hypothetical protein
MIKLWGSVKPLLLVLIKSSIFWTAIVQALIMSFCPFVEMYFAKHPSLYGCFVLFIFMFLRIFILSGGLMLIKTISLMKDKMINIIYMIGLCCIMIVGCTTTQKLDPEVYYKRDMTIKYDKNTRTGTMVLPLKNKYDLYIKSEGTLDLFTLTTCHRLITQEDAGGFFSPREVKYTYVPDAPMELTFACPMQLAGYDKDGQHSWGFVDIETADTTLPAKIKCNGEAYNANGASICQSKMGLIQSIEFDTEVVFSPEAQKSEFCKSIEYTTKDNKEFIYKMPRRECAYNWMEKKNPHREHRLNTIGFESVIVRK